MISFVWSDPLPIYSGRGGSESFTIGILRELISRGIDARIITVGLGKQDGRQFFPDIPFYSVPSIGAVSLLDDTLIFINWPHPVKTKKKSAVLLHFQPPSDPKLRSFYKRSIRNKEVIVNSKFAQELWAEYLSIPPRQINVVYPFADPAFDKVKRRKLSFKYKRVPILYAGRLSPEKGLYTLLEAMHHTVFRGYRLTVTTAGNQTTNGKVMEAFLRHHPWINVVEATHTPAETAKLFAKHDIVVMPSNPNYWHEPFGFWREAFGMVSIEAQHAGCYVVATNDGGLKETDCGGLVLFEPGSSYSLSLAMEKISRTSPLTIKQRKQAMKHFTLAELVSALMTIIDKLQKA